MHLLNHDMKVVNDQELLDNTERNLNNWRYNLSEMDLRGKAVEHSTKSWWH